MSRPVRALLVEDSTLLREGLVRLLEEDGVEVLEALGTAERLLETVESSRPDLVILDIRLPPTFRDEGVRAAIAVREAVPEVGVLLLSQYVETTYARELLASGVRGVGYLLKDRVTDLEQLHDAVATIAAGGTLLDPALVQQLLRAKSDPLEQLTPREHDVLRLMAEGRSNAAIADELVVTVGAVEKHVTRILGKLGLEDSPAAHRRVLAVLRFLQS